MDAPALDTSPRDPGSVDQPGLVTGELPEIQRLDTKTARKRFRLTLKLVAFVAVLYFFVLPLIPGFRSAWTELQQVRTAAADPRFRAPARRLVLVRAPHPRRARGTGPAHHADAGVPHPDEHARPVEHRARRERRRFGARLPAAHPVGHPRHRRRVRAGHGRYRLGGRCSTSSCGSGSSSRSRSGASTRSTDSSPSSGSS